MTWVHTNQLRHCLGTRLLVLSCFFRLSCKLMQGWQAVTWIFNEQKASKLWMFNIFSQFIVAGYIWVVRHMNNAIQCRWACMILSRMAFIQTQFETWEPLCNYDHCCWRSILYCLMNCRVLFFFDNEMYALSIIKVLPSLGPLAACYLSRMAVELAVWEDYQIAWTRGIGTACFTWLRDTDQQALDETQCCGLWSSWWVTAKHGDSFFTVLTFAPIICS